MATRLDAELAMVLAAMTGIEDALTTDPIDRAMLEAARATLAATLAGHFAFKETLYDRMRSVGGQSVEDVVRRSRARTLALIVAYRFHLSDWTVEKIAADRCGYRDEARGLIARAHALSRCDLDRLAPALEALIAQSPLLADLRTAPVVIVTTTR